MPWIKADVVFDTDSEAREAERLVREKKLAGISADIGGVTETLEVIALGEDGSPSDWLRTVTAGEIVGGTLLPMPAFGDARIEFGEDGALTAWILEEGSRTSDRRLIEPFALTWRDPAPLMFSDRTTEHPHDGAVFIGNLSNFRREETTLYDLGRQEALAAAFTPNPELFTDPMLPAVTKPRIEEGRYAGHGAAWGTCHLAFPNACVTPPEDEEFAYARWKEVDGVFGVPIYRHPKGDIHAPLHLGLEEAREWYERECLLAGLGELGPDTFGIWVSGAADPEVDGMFLSGDWRRVDGDLELIAFLACERPAFPLALVASDQQTALVAAGVVLETLPTDPTLEILSLLKREVVALREQVEPIFLEREAGILLDSLT